MLPRLKLAVLWVGVQVIELAELARGRVGELGGCGGVWSDLELVGKGYVETEVRDAI